MADQSIQFSEGIAMDIMVKIQDHYTPTDFMVLDMEEEDDSPIILGRPFLNTINAVIYVTSGQIYFLFSGEKVRCCFNSYTTYEQPKKTRSQRRSRSSHRQEDQLPRNGWGIMKEKLRRTCANPYLMNGTMKSLKHPPKKKPLRQHQAHRLNMYGKRR
jgi:hypothetical protein